MLEFYISRGFTCEIIKNFIFLLEKDLKNIIPWLKLLIKYTVKEIMKNIKMYFKLYT